MPAVKEEQGAGIPEWVVTFGDMMSLLLTFFIMLFSMSEIEENQKYQAVADALRKQFGNEASILALLDGDHRPRNSVFAKLASLGRARRANTMNGGDKVRAPVGENPRVCTIRNDGQTTTGGVIYFPEGAWELSQQNKRTLRAIVREIGGKPQKIEIRGHTSSRPLPPASPYKTHWELAYARCEAVLEVLVELGIEPKRIRIAVAAANEPAHLGNDPLLFKENSRVEVYLLDEWVQGLQATAKEK